MKTIIACVFVFLIAGCKEQGGICKDGYLYDLQDGTMMPRMNDKGLISCQ